MVGFVENIASDQGFDVGEGSNQWSGEDINIRGAMFLSWVTLRLHTIVLHLANKNDAYRISPINSRLMIINFTFDFSAATADGTSAQCDDEPGCMEAA